MISKALLLTLLVSVYELNYSFADDNIITIGPCKAKLDNGSTIDLCKT